MIEVERRDFLKLAGVLGTAVVINLFKPDIVKAFELVSPQHKLADLCYLHGAQCTGCTVSFANCTDPDLVEVLARYLAKPMPTWDIGLPYFYPTIMPMAGEQAMAGIDAWKEAEFRVLVVEGAVSGREYCDVAETSFEDLVADTAEHADAIVAYGTCASYGGIPAAEPNPTQCRGVKDFLRQRGIGKAVINIPGCPAHPDWLVLTLASVLVGAMPTLDEHGRPQSFYSKVIHDEECPRRGYYDRGEFATEFGQEECLWKLGCRGPVTNADCPVRLWNDGTSFCINAGGPCIGCTQPGFPDEMSPFYVEIESVPAILDVPIEEWGKLLAVAGVIGVGAHLVRSVVRKRREKEE